MFDNLRESASDSPFYEEETNDLYKEPASKPMDSIAAPSPRKRGRGSRFLGMNGVQRFFLSMMLFFIVCLLGTLAMLLLGKMAVF
ncbi:MAG TPA: hypothetical protein PKK96_13200 [Anaerolineales bacterium]|jgi:hypothetical protein|nr:hypothetical protein [Anaerolineales bacterium]HMR99167.1 hypothetical protein [Anaerolineales bacterium]HNQ94690.1 hypothetical protein [Anaerolineales bacterium]HNS61958.1 hypothetical protein [Anaerolineales bacterium]